MRKTLFFGLAIAALWAVSSAGAQGFVNGGFELGNFNGWTITPTSNGQTTVQTVETFDIDGPAGPLPPSLAGKFSVGKVNSGGAPGGIELTQSLALVGGNSYTFHFDYAAKNNDFDPGHTGNAEGGVFELIVNGTAITQGAIGFIPNMGAEAYGALTATYTAPSSGNYTVGARITRPYIPPTFNGQPCLFQYVDNFTPIPEPAALALLGLGLLLRRR